MWIWRQGFIQAVLISGRRHKKPNLIEFWNSIFIKFYFKAYWCWTCIKLLCKVFSILSYLFALKMLKSQDFSLPPWTPTRALPWICCGAYSTLRPPPAFYNFRKLNLCLKTDISKTAWINPKYFFVFLVWLVSVQRIVTFWRSYGIRKNFTNN